MDAYKDNVIFSIPTVKDTTLRDIVNKAGTKRKRVGQEAYDIPWTASRCNRLLRTITSRILVLQKLAASNRSHNHEGTSGGMCEEVTHCGALERRSAALASPSKDPEWLPGPTQKSGLRTYNRKSRRNGSNINAALEWTRRKDSVGLSTPFIRRMLHIERDSATSPSSTTLPYRQKRNTLAHFSLKPSSTAEEAQNNLIRALSSFLISTSVEERPQRTGASTLMSACLRRVPSYIHMIEEDNDEYECESGRQSRVTDFTAEIYDELETLGTAQNSGWAGLRVVVRAHGIWHLRNAIRNKLLTSRITEALINVCTKQHAFIEAQQLVEAFAESRQSVPMDLCSRLIDFGDNHNSAAFLFRTMGNLLEREVISGADLTSQRNLWQAVLKSICGASGQAEAIEFLTSCIVSCSISGSSKALEATHLGATMRGIAILLTGMCIQKRGLDASSPASGVELDEILHRIATTSSIRMLSLNLSHDIFKSIQCPFFLGSLVLQVIRSSQSDGVGYMNVELISAAGLAMDSVRDLRSTTDMDNFISNLALCIGRSDPDAGDRLLFGIVRRLLDFTDNHLARPSTVLRSLALNGAMDYSEKRMTRETISFAEEVEDDILHSTRVMTKESFISKSKHNDYRWEEGLCEWIAVTPATGTTVRRKSLELSWISDADLSCCSEKEAKVNTARKAKKSVQRKCKYDGASALTGKICAPTNSSPNHLLLASVRDSCPFDNASWDKDIGDTDLDELAASAKKPCKASGDVRIRAVRTINPVKAIDRPLKMIRYAQRSWLAPIDFDGSDDELGW